MRLIEFLGLQRSAAAWVSRHKILSVAEASSLCQKNRMPCGAATSWTRSADDSAMGCSGGASGAREAWTPVGAGDALIQSPQCRVCVFKCGAWLEVRARSDRCLAVGRAADIINVSALGEFEIHLRPRISLVNRPLNAPIGRYTGVANVTMHTMHVPLPIDLRWKTKLYEGVQ